MLSVHNYKHMYVQYAGNVVTIAHAYACIVEMVV